MEEYLRSNTPLLNTSSSHTTPPKTSKVSPFKFKSHPGQPFETVSTDINGVTLISNYNDSRIQFSYLTPFGKCDIEGVNNWKLFMTVVRQGKDCKVVFSEGDLDVGIIVKADFVELYNRNKICSSKYTVTRAGYLESLDHLVKL